MRWRVCRSRWRVCRRARAGGHFGGFAVITRLQALPRLPRFRLRRSGSSRAHAPPGESHPHSAKLSTLYTTKLTPSPRTPHPCFTATTSLYLSLGGKPDGATPPGSPPVICSDAPGLRLHGPGRLAMRLLPFHRAVTRHARLAPLMEQRGGLLMHAGTVELVGFACATRPRRLVKGKEARAGREGGSPGGAPDFPRVCVGTARCLYPDFRGSGSLPLSSRVAPSAHEDRWRRESLVEPRPRREQGPSLSAKPSPVGVMVRRPAKWGRFGPPPNARCRRPERGPGGAAPYRAQERRGGADWCPWIPPRGCGALLGRLSGERWPVSSTSATRAETLRTQAGNAHRPRNLH